MRVHLLPPPYARDMGQVETEGLHLGQPMEMLPVSQARSMPPHLTANPFMPPQCSPFHTHPSAPSPTPLHTPAPPTPHIQPMDVDCTRAPHRDPRHRACYNCGHLGHVACNCPEPRAQRIRMSETSPSPAAEDLRALIAEMVRSEVTKAAQPLPSPTNPPR